MMGECRGGGIMKECRDEGVVEECKHGGMMKQHPVKHDGGTRGGLMTEEEI